MSQPAPPPPPIDATPPPPAPPLTFPEYGQGGDYAGQRRARRAFRYGVLAVVGFTLALWIYERYGRLERHETHYVSALTLEPASARPFLHNIVREEAEARQEPTPLYQEALAGVEEPDKVIPAYEAAVRLQPSDPWLLLKFGCELFQRQDFDKAREKFREAGVHPPRNALPAYLEAAALAAGLAPNSDLSEAMAIVARANNSGAPILFPTPLWHATLPKHGEFYANHRRELATKLCAPLSRFKQLLVERARLDIERGAHGDWAAWLEKLQDMGNRIANARDVDDLAEPTQVVAGLNIEGEAIALRKTLAEATGADTAGLEREATRISAAMKLFAAFETAREAEIEHSRAAVKRPFSLAFSAIVPIAVCYLLIAAYSFLFAANARAVALPHTRLGAGVLLGAMLVFGGALHVLGLAGLSESLANSTNLAWRVACLALIVFGVAYPTLSLPRVGAVLARAKDDSPETRRAAWRARRDAGAALERRYFGALLGGLIVMFALWIIIFRLSAGIYPDQFAFLVSGAEELEQATIAQALQRAPQ